MPFSDYTATILGWLFVASATGGVYLYYNSDTRRGPIQARNHRAAPAQSESAPARPKASKSNKPQHTKPKGEQTPRVPSFIPVETSSAAQHGEKEEKEDMSWARELADKKKGTSFTAPSRQQSKQKTVSQSNANKVAASVGSSTGGADADDDLSDHVPSGGDVRDMLEPASSGPSVLRINAPENQQPPREKRAPKPAQQQESKKQRQNKRKAEEAKAAREAEEKERKALAEKQRRTAREARGEPAKNGLASAQTSTAWTAPKLTVAAAGPATGPAASPAVLLDTFVPGIETKQNGKAQPKTNGKDSSNKSSQDIPYVSEEEQLKIIQDNDESSWNTVSKKKKATKQTKEADEPGADKEQNAVKPPPATIKTFDTPLYKAVGHSHGANGGTNGPDQVADDIDGWTVA